MPGLSTVFASYNKQDKCKSICWVHMFTDKNKHKQRKTGFQARQTLLTIRHLYRHRAQIYYYVNKHNNSNKHTFASPNTIKVSDAGLLYTSGLLMTNNIFLDFLIVTLLTPDTLFSPSFDIALRDFFSLRLCLALLTGSSVSPAAAAISLVMFGCAASPSSSSGNSSSLSLSVPEITTARQKHRNFNIFEGVRSNQIIF